MTIFVTIQQQMMAELVESTKSAIILMSQRKMLCFLLLLSGEIISTPHECIINKTIRHSFDREGLTFSSKRLVGSKTRLLRETPCKFIEDERSLVAAITRGKCVEDELQIRQSPVSQKVPLRGTYSIQYCDQAANLSEVLAWSFSLKSVLRTANIFDVFPGQ